MKAWLVALGVVIAGCISLFGLVVVGVVAVATPRTPAPSVAVAPLTSASETTTSFTITNVGSAAKEISASGVNVSSWECTNNTATPVYRVTQGATAITNGVGPYCTTCTKGIGFKVPLEKVYLLANGGTPSVQCSRIVGGVFGASDDGMSIGAADARYVELNGANTPTTGEIHFGAPVTSDCETLTYGATTNIDFSTKPCKLLTITGNLILTASNMAQGRQVTLFITGDTVQRTLSTPTTWRYENGNDAAAIGPNERVVMHFIPTGTTDATLTVLETINPPFTEHAWLENQDGFVINPGTGNLTSSTNTKCGFGTAHNGTSPRDGCIFEGGAGKVTVRSVAGGSSGDLDLGIGSSGTGGFNLLDGDAVTKAELRVDNNGLLIYGKGGHASGNPPGIYLVGQSITGSVRVATDAHAADALAFQYEGDLYSGAQVWWKLYGHGVWTTPTTTNGSIQAAMYRRAHDAADEVRAKALAQEAYDAGVEAWAENPGNATTRTDWLNHYVSGYVHTSLAKPVDTAWLDAFVNDFVSSEVDEYTATHEQPFALDDDPSTVRDESVVALSTCSAGAVTVDVSSPIVNITTGGASCTVTISGTSFGSAGVNEDADFLVVVADDPGSSHTVTFTGAPISTNEQCVLSKQGGSMRLHYSKAVAKFVVSSCSDGPLFPGQVIAAGGMEIVGSVANALGQTIVSDSNATRFVCKSPTTTNPCMSSDSANSTNTGVNIAQATDNDTITLVADGTDEMSISPTGVTGTQSTSGTMHSWRVPTGIATTLPTKPTCSTSTNAGQIIYVDDSDDANSGMLCVCRANSAGTYAWTRVDDNSTACI